MKAYESYTKVFYFFKKKYEGFEKTSFCGVLDFYRTFADRISDERWQELLDMYESEFKKYMIKHDFTITHKQEFFCIIMVLMELAHVSNSEKIMPKKFYKERLEAAKVWNKLIAIIDKIDLPTGYKKNSAIKTEITEIVFKGKTKDSIRFTRSYEISDIMKALKNSGFKTASEVIRVNYESYNTIIKNTVKLLHNFIEKHTDIILKETKTSDKICRIIYDLLIDANIFLPKDIGDSDIEDFIRTLILRSKLQ